MRIRFVLFLAAGSVLAWGIPPSEAASGSTPATLRAPRVFDSEAYASSVTLADVTGDGILDLIVPQPIRQIGILPGLGDGTFGPATRFDTIISPETTVAADLTGDGAPDLAAISGDVSSLSVLVNEGNGTFGPDTVYSLTGTVTGLAAGDVDVDGHVDLVVSRQTGGASLTVLLNAGDGTFDAHAAYGTGRLDVMAVADLNADGAPDVVGATYPGIVEVFMNQGDGALEAPVKYPAGQSPAALVVTDLTGDDVPDAAFVDLGDNALEVLPNNGDGTFGTLDVIPTGAYPYRLAEADVDHDADTDLAVVANGTLKIFENDGAGTLTDRAHVTLGRSPLQIASGDLDRDGRPDFALATVRGVAILMAIGDARYLASRSFDAGRTPYAIAVGDLNGDLRSDLAVVDNPQDSGAKGFVSILLNSGPDAFRTAAEVPAGVGPAGIAVADLDEDGHADLAIVGQHNDFSNVAIALGNGEGTFRGGQVLSVVNFPLFVATQDFNADGHLDLALGVLTSASRVQLTVILGKGDGTFGARVTRFGGQKDPTGLAISDVNVDGRPDVVIVGADNAQRNGSISVFLVHENGSISEARRTSLPFLPAGFAMANLDADAFPDIVVTDSDGAVGVMPGQGDGRFGSGTVYSTEIDARAVAVGDMTGDGIQDLVVGFELGNLSVLAGEPGGTFADPVTYANGEGPPAASAASLVLGQFDADALLDVAVVQNAAGTVAILRQLPS